MPWEFLYDSAESRFLALSTETPIVRRLPTQTDLPPLPVTLPIRVLVLIASPKGLPPLETAQEWANLTQALADLQQQGRVVLERLEPPTLSALQRALRRGDYHVFHFVGHGGFDSGSQAGLLYLEDETGQADAVPGERLGTMLHDERSLRLAVLNACEGGRTARDDPFAGVAQSLIQQDIPAVVAMQFAVSDEAAVRGAREFYLALADGLPVDAALTEARKAIYGKGMGTEWATPVLYMTAPNGRIFDIAQGAAGKVASPPPVAPLPPPVEPPVKTPTAVETCPQSPPKRPTRMIALATAAVLLVALIATGLATRGFGLISPPPTLGPTATPSSTPTTAPNATVVELAVTQIVEPNFPIVVLDTYSTEPAQVTSLEPFTLTLRLCNLGVASAYGVLADVRDPDLAPVGTGQVFVVGNMGSHACIDLAKRYVLQDPTTGRRSFEFAIQYADSSGKTFVPFDKINLLIIAPPSATSTKTLVPTVRIIGTIRPSLTPRLVVTPRLTSTPTPDSTPRFGAISFCQAIDSSTNRCVNPTTKLPAKTTKFYISFAHRNIPLGSRFDRLWYHNNKLFKKASSTWDDKSWNSPTGVEFTFFEYTQGFAAGVYRVELWIAGQLLQSGEVTIGG